jgi:hypothetical protein
VTAAPSSVPTGDSVADAQLGGVGREGGELESTEASEKDEQLEEDKEREGLLQEELSALTNKEEKLGAAYGVSPASHQDAIGAAGGSYSYGSYSYSGADGSGADGSAADAGTVPTAAATVVYDDDGGYYDDDGGYYDDDGGYYDDDGAYDGGEMSGVDFAGVAAASEGEGEVLALDNTVVEDGGASEVTPTAGLTGGFEGGDLASALEAASASALQAGGTDVDEDPAAAIDQFYYYLSSDDDLIEVADTTTPTETGNDLAAAAAMALPREQVDDQEAADMAATDSGVVDTFGSDGSGELTAGEKEVGYGIGAGGGIEAEEVLGSYRYTVERVEALSSASRIENSVEASEGEGAASADGNGGRNGDESGSGGAGEMSVDGGVGTGSGERSTGSSGIGETLVAIAVAKLEKDEQLEKLLEEKIDILSGKEGEPGFADPVEAAEASALAESAVGAGEAQPTASVDRSSITASALTGEQPVTTAAGDEDAEAEPVDGGGLLLGDGDAVGADVLAGIEINDDENEGETLSSRWADRAAIDSNTLQAKVGNGILGEVPTPALTTVASMTVAAEDSMQEKIKTRLVTSQASLMGIEDVEVPTPVALAPAPAAAPAAFVIPVVSPALALTTSAILGEEEGNPKADGRIDGSLQEKVEGLSEEENIEIAGSTDGADGADVADGADGADGADDAGDAGDGDAGDAGDGDAGDGGAGDAGDGTAGDGTAGDGTAGDGTAGGADGAGGAGGADGADGADTISEGLVSSHAAAAATAAMEKLYPGRFTDLIAASSYVDAADDAGVAGEGQEPDAGGAANGDDNDDDDDDGEIALLDGLFVKEEEQAAKATEEVSGGGDSSTFLFR